MTSEVEYQKSSKIWQTNLKFFYSFFKASAGSGGFGGGSQAQAQAQSQSINIGGGGIGLGGPGYYGGKQNMGLFVGEFIVNSLRPFVCGFSKKLITHF